MRRVLSNVSFLLLLILVALLSLRNRIHWEQQSVDLAIKYICLDHDNNRVAEMTF